MANTDPIFFGAVASPAISFVNGDGTATKDLFTAGVDGGGLNSISATSTDTVDVIIVLTLTISATDYQLGEINIPAGSGTDGSSPAVNLLSGVSLPFLQNDGSLVIGENAIVKANPKVVVAGAFQVDLVGFGGQYAAA